MVFWEGGAINFNGVNFWGPGQIRGKRAESFLQKKNFGFVGGGGGGSPIFGEKTGGRKNWGALEKGGNRVLKNLFVFGGQKLGGGKFFFS